MWGYSLFLFRSGNPGVMKLSNVFNMTLIGCSSVASSTLITFWICMKNPSSLSFEQFHNQYNHYSALGGLTPCKKSAGNIRYLPENFQLPEKLIIFPGNIPSVLFTAAVFWMSLERDFPYLKISNICMSGQPLIQRKKRLYIYHNHKLVTEYGYPLLRSSILLPKID